MNIFGIQYHSLRAWISTRKRVIVALMMRELISRFGRRGIGFLWLFIEPVLFVAVLAGFRYIWTGWIKHDFEPITFAFVSFLPFMIMRTMITRSVESIGNNKNILCHRPINPIDVVIARNVLEFLSILLVGLFGMAFCSIFLNEYPDDLFLWIIVILLTALFSNGISLCVSAISVLLPLAKRIMQLSIMLVLPFSGAMWMLSDLPIEFRDVAFWIPMVSLHEAMREAQFGPRVLAHHDLGYVMFWILGTTLLGLSLLRICAPPSGGYGVVPISVENGGAALPTLSR